MGRLVLQDFEKILSKHGRPKTYIETGTRWAEQIVIAAPAFDHLYGVELSAYCFDRSMTATSHLNNVTMNHGDSRLWLPNILRAYREPCFILLDAHFCKVKPPIEKSEFPLWEELDAVKRHGQADIVVVDDVHTFGRERPELKHTPDAKEWETVIKEAILAFFGDRVHDYDEVGDGFVVWMKCR